MSSNILKSAWKEKIDINNCFDDNFLSEKDKALQPLEFLFESQNDIILNDKNLLNKINEENPRKKSLKESDLYDSNIVIIQTLSENESELTTFNRIEKQVEEINKIILNKKLKKLKKQSSKSKKLKYKNRKMQNKII